MVTKPLEIAPKPKGRLTGTPYIPASALLTEAQVLDRFHLSYRRWRIMRGHPFYLSPIRWEPIDGVEKPLFSAIDAGRTIRALERKS